MQAGEDADHRRFSQPHAAARSPALQNSLIGSAASTRRVSTMSTSTQRPSAHAPPDGLFSPMSKQPARFSLTSASSVASIQSVTMQRRSSRDSAKQQRRQSAVSNSWLFRRDFSAHGTTGDAGPSILPRRRASLLNPHHRRVSSMRVTDQHAAASAMAAAPPADHFGLGTGSSDATARNVNGASGNDDRSGAAAGYSDRDDDDDDDDDDDLNFSDSCDDEDSRGSAGRNSAAGAEDSEISLDTPFLRRANEWFQKHRGKDFPLLETDTGQQANRRPLQKAIIRAQPMRNRDGIVEIRARDVERMLLKSEVAYTFKNKIPLQEDSKSSNSGAGPNSRAPFSERFFDTVRTEYATRYLESLGADPTPSNLATVRRAINIGNAEVKAFYRSQGWQWDYLSVDPSAAERVNRAARLRKDLTKTDVFNLRVSLDSVSFDTETNALTTDPNDLPVVRDPASQFRGVVSGAMTPGVATAAQAADGGMHRSSITSGAPSATSSATAPSIVPSLQQLQQRYLAAFDPSSQGTDEAAAATVRARSRAVTSIGTVITVDGEDDIMPVSQHPTPRSADASRILRRRASDFVSSSSTASLASLQPAASPRQRRASMMPSTRAMVDQQQQQQQQRNKPELLTPRSRTEAETPHSNARSRGSSCSSSISGGSSTGKIHRASSSGSGVVSGLIAKELAMPFLVTKRYLTTMQRAFCTVFPWPELAVRHGADAVKASKQLVLSADVAKLAGLLCHYTYGVYVAGNKEHGKFPDKRRHSVFASVLEQHGVIDASLRAKHPKLASVVLVPVLLLCLRITVDGVMQQNYPKWCSTVIGRDTLEQIDHAIQDVLDDHRFRSFIGALELPSSKQPPYLSAAMATTGHKTKRGISPVAAATAATSSAPRSSRLLLRDTSSYYATSPLIRCLFSNASSAKTRTLVRAGQRRHGCTAVLQEQEQMFSTAAPYMDQAAERRRKALYGLALGKVTHKDIVQVDSARKPAQATAASRAPSREKSPRRGLLMHAGGEAGSSSADWQAAAAMSANTRHLPAFESKVIEVMSLVEQRRRDNQDAWRASRSSSTSASTSNSARASSGKHNSRGSNEAVVGSKSQQPRLSANSAVLRMQLHQRTMTGPGADIG